MSRKLQLAANEKDQTKISAYTKGSPFNRKDKHEQRLSDNTDSSVTSVRINNYIEEKSESVASTKRKRSQESTPPNRDHTKKIIMSTSPQEHDDRPATQQLEEEEDETTLSPELAKLERILSRKQKANLAGIKDDIKKLLENEELIKKQQETISELKKENHELNVKYNRLEQKHHQLQTRVTNIENELYSSNLIFSGLSEAPNEEGPDRYLMVIEAIANTVNAQTREEQLQIARRIPIKKSTRLGKYNSYRGRSMLVQFVYQEDCEYLLANKGYLPQGVYVDRHYSEDTENKCRILRPIYRVARNHSSYRGRCTMEGEYLKIHGVRYATKDIHRLPEELSGFKCTSKETHDVLGFFGELNPLSNFYNCDFRYQNQVFHSSEQLIQYNKAKHFNDHITMAQILYANNPLESKRLARDISNYNEENWKMVAKNMCYEGLKEKFLQNPTVAKALMATKDKTLVECSHDKIWGNGIPLSDKSWMDKQRWHNTGILGEMLMDIRKELINSEEAESFMDTTETTGNG